MCFARTLAGVALAVCGVPPAAALGAPAIMPGWPVPAPGGASTYEWDLLPGPGGGVAAVGRPGTSYAVAAYRSDGTRRWAVARDQGCGNCYGSGPEPSLRPDGSIGPVGIASGGGWDVDRNGRFVQPGCSGLVLADLTCVVVSGAWGQAAYSTRFPMLTATRGGVTRWTRVEDDLQWVPEMDGYPPAVADAAGTVYVGLGDGTTAPGASRVVALDGGTGAVRWRRLMYGRAVAGLDRGVLVNTDDGSVVALDADGGERWRLLTVTGGARRAVLDVARGRVVVQTGPPLRSRIATVRLATGRLRWLSSRGWTAGGAAVGRTGTVYIAEWNARGDSRARAVKPSGVTAWTLPAATSVGGVVELSDGTVVVSTGNDVSGLLVRVDPRRRQATVHTGSVDVSPRRVRTGCFAIAWRRRDCGTIVRFRMAAAATVTVRAVPSAPGTTTWTFRAPAGTSYARYGAFSSRTTAIVATWREKGRRRVVRIPVTVVGSR